MNPIFSGFDAFYKKTSTLVEVSALGSTNFRTTKLAPKAVKIAQETTITLIINDSAVLSLLITPRQIEAHIIGYLFTEGIVSSINDIEAIDYKETMDKFFVWIKKDITKINLKAEIRTSGCVGIKQHYEEIQFKIESDLKITPEIIFQAQTSLVQKEQLWKTSGGTHMAALCSKKGDILHFAEDVGRHNTIDKIIGESLLSGTNINQCFAVISGRLSAAMVMKIARARVPILISKAAPIDKGIVLACQVHMTLIGFAREPELNIYNYPERIDLRKSE